MSAHQRLFSQKQTFQTGGTRASPSRHSSRLPVAVPRSQLQVAVGRSTPRWTGVSSSAWLGPVTPPWRGGGAPAAHRPAKKARPKSAPHSGRLELSPRPRVRLPVQIITMGCIEARELLGRPRARNEPRGVPEVVTKLEDMARMRGHGRGRGPWIDPMLIEDCVHATGHATSGDPGCCAPGLVRSC